jgi:very-short-patch-repair endonuclease
MTSQGLSNTLWAMATLGWQPSSAERREGLEIAGIKLSTTMTPQHLSMTMWSFAQLRWKPTVNGLHDALEMAVLTQLPRAISQEVANLLWAMATLNWHLRRTELCDVFEAAAIRVVSSFTEQGLANSMWAMATLGWRPSDAYFSAMGTSAVFRSNLQQDTLCQLFQVHLASRLLNFGRFSLSPSLLPVAAQAFRTLAKRTSISKTQREVGHCLTRLGIEYELEHLTEDGFFSIDIAVVDRRIAIEFDGPLHFTSNTLEPLGAIRERLLTAIGWRVISIPFFEWDPKLGSHATHEVQDAYMRRLL